MSHVYPAASLAKFSPHGHYVHARPASGGASSDEELSPVNGIRPGDPNSRVSEIGFMMGTPA